jgi:chromosome partitioning protein
MKTLAIISRKGGSGKSTIAVHLCAYALSQNIRPALIDLDPQASALDWNSGRTEHDPISPKLSVTKANPADLPKLKQLAEENGVALLIIDTAPHADSAAAAAAQLADFALIPCRPARFDMKAIGSSVKIAQLSNTAAAVVINAAPPVGSMAEQARTALEAQGIKVVPPVLHQRAAFSHALIDCRAVHEYDPEGKAAQEMAELFDCIKQGLRL